MSKQDIYDRLGVKKIINAAGTYTLFGGSLMSEVTLRAMEEAAKSFVDLRELQQRVNSRLAFLTKNEGACVTNGAAAGLYISIAAAISMKAGKPFKYINREQIASSEIIILAAHRNPYDYVINQLGATLKTVGYPNNLTDPNKKDLLYSICDKTAAIVYAYNTERGGWLPEGALDLNSVLEVAKETGVPVIVDAAAQLPPVSNLWALTGAGADAAVFSGGKDLRGPQSSGLLVGKKDLIDIANELNFPNYGIGRMLKVGKEEIIGLLLAVEQYMELDHKKRELWAESVVEKIVDNFRDSSLFYSFRSYPNEAGQPMARAALKIIEPYCSVDKIVYELQESEPSIYVGRNRDTIFINPMCLKEEEVEIVINQLLRLEQNYTRRSD